MICNKCGANIADGSAFCTSCGSPITADVPSQTNAYDPYASSAASPYGEPANPAESAYSEPATPIYTTPAPKKKSKLPIVITAAVLAVALIAGVVIFAFASGGGNSPIEELVEAYANTRRDGYEAKYTVTTEHSEGDESDVAENIEEYTEALGVLDMETGMREFSMTKKENRQEYSTPKYNYYNSLRTSTSYDGEPETYDSGNLYNYGDETPSVNEYEFINILLEGDYKELAAYFNSTMFGPYGSSILDEKGFAKTLKKVNRKLSDEEYFNEIFGYEREESGSEITYKFSYDSIDVFQWFYEIIVESPEAFCSEEKHQWFLERLEDQMDDDEEKNLSETVEMEVVIEDGYIVSQKTVKTTSYDKTMSVSIDYTDKEKEEIVRVSSKVTTEIEYEEFGTASADKEIVNEFKARKEQLGSNYNISWYKDEVAIYDEDYNKVN